MKNLIISPPAGKDAAPRRPLAAAGRRDGRRRPVRVSLGLVSNFADVFAFRDFARSLLEGCGRRPAAPR